MIFETIAAAALAISYVTAAAYMVFLTFTEIMSWFASRRSVSPHDRTRLAFTLTTTNRAGQSYPSVAVYLRRGRAVLAVFFPVADGAQPSIAGRTTIPDIVALFASRVARVPDSVANG